MRVFNKSLLIGLGAGVAVTLLVLDAWSYQFRQEILTNANPWILQPFAGLTTAAIPKSSERLPKPWLPESPGGLHEDWAVQALDGRTVPLSTFRGKVVFLNFWATYCAPCLEEMPGIDRLHNSLRNDQVAFLAVSREEGSTVKAFLLTKRLAIPVYVLRQELPPQIPVSGIPVTYILDRSGRARYRWQGPVNWDDDDVRSFLRKLEEE